VERPVASGKYISYLRVSTQQQGASGLGLEAQKKAVADYLNGGRWRLLAEYVEVESGKNNEREELQKALRACRLHGATLLVAKLDRLARNAYFLLGLQESGVDFVACDMPAANRLTVGILAMVAEEEARMISARTKAALRAVVVAVHHSPDKKGYKWEVPMPADFFETVRTFRREIGAVAGYVFASDQSREGILDTTQFGKWLRRAEKKAKLPKLDGSLWHAYRRKWAIERKFLPLKDVAAAGGWKGVKTLLEVYQQPDAESVLAVTSVTTKLREKGVA
jgi:hypothetical protein